MGISTTPSAVARLVKEAHDHFVALQMARQKPLGDKAVIDQEMEALKVSLEKLMEATEQQTVKPLSR